MVTIPMPRFLQFIAILFLVTACETDEANRYYGGEKYSPRDVSSVEILVSRPVRPFIVIADFQARYMSKETLRKKAAKIGADAVIVSFVGGWASLGSQWAHEDPHSASSTRSLGTAIRYK